MKIIFREVYTTPMHMKFRYHESVHVLIVILLTPKYNYCTDMEIGLETYVVVFTFVLKQNCCLDCFKLLWF